MVRKHKRFLKIIIIGIIFILNISMLCSFAINDRYGVVKKSSETTVTTTTTEDFTDTNKVIPLEDAKNQFLKYGKPMLMYIRPWSDDDGNRKLKLVYSIVNGPYYYLNFNGINAYTGSPVNSMGQETDLYYEKVGERGEIGLGVKADNLNKSLDIEVVKQMAVLEALKCGIQIDDSNYRVQESYNTNWYGLNQNVYNIAWSDKLQETGCVFKITMDALTGNILELYTNNPSGASAASEAATQSIISWQDGKAIAENFIKARFPQFMGNIVFLKNEPKTFETPGSNGYFYSFWRIVNGALYPENNVSVLVDDKTGQIKSYGYRWEYIDFPEISKDIITQDQAAGIFMDKIGLQLGTKGQTANSQDKGVMVYEVKPTKAAYIDPYTGNIKDSKGNDIVFEEEDGQ